MKSLGGSSKRLESKLRRGPVYFSKGKEVERRILEMNRLSFSLDVSNIFDSMRSYNIQVVLPELAVLRLKIYEEVEKESIKSNVTGPLRDLRNIPVVN